MYFFDPGRVSRVKRSLVRPSVVLFWGLMVLPAAKERREDKRDIVEENEKPEFA